MEGKGGGGGGEMQCATLNDLRVLAHVCFTSWSAQFVNLPYENKFSNRLEWIILQFYAKQARKF